MKSYNQVYNASRAEVQEQRKAVYEAQKRAIVNILKENYNITGKLENCDFETRSKLAAKLKEFWSPKTGINTSGVKLLNENRLILTEKSSTNDFRDYIIRHAKKNIDSMAECFRSNCQDMIVESFNADIKQMTGKTLKPKFIIETVWNVVSERIKNGRKF